MAFDGYDVMDFKDASTKKRRKYRQGEEQPTDGIDSLPQDIARDIISSLPQDMARDIISRLPMISLIQFRFVCKAWEKLSYDPGLVSLHLSKALKSNSYLIFHCDFQIKNLLYFVEFSHHDGEKDKVRKFEIPFSDRMPEFKVVGSCNGLLCLENSLLDNALYIYNPFTSKYKELPESTPIYHEQLVMYGFGFHPITNQYKVIKIAYYPNPEIFDINTTYKQPWIIMLHHYKQSDVQVFCLGSNKWRSIGRIPYQLDRLESAVLLNGRLHWTTNYGNYNGHCGKLIVSFDLSDELFREVPTPAFDFRVHRKRYHLATLGGCLCIAVPVNGIDGCLDIWVMKEYNMEESWVKEFHIGAFFPNLIGQELQHSRGIRRRVLCLLKNGEILVEDREGTLVSFNPENGLLTNVTFRKMPRLFQTVLHVGSLNWV